MTDKKDEPIVSLKSVESIDKSQESAGSSSAIDALTLIDEHEEEVSVGGKTERQRGIYLLPNLFTTGALFCGFYAMISAMDGRFESAAMAIFAAMVFDGLDGRVARLTNTQSKFGAEYDSLSDMVSFGVAPALVVFNLALGDLGKFGWTCAFIYVACAALRLARFNTQIDSADNNFFTGLASPSAAALVAGTVWVCSDEGWLGAQLPNELAIIVACVTALTGLLMILNVPYNSFKGLDLKGRVHFVAMILVVLAFGLVMLDPARVLLAMAVIYALSGPVVLALQKLRG